MAASEQSQRKTCTDTAGDDCRRVTSPQNKKKKKPPNSSQHTAEATSRASQTDMEQHARAPADAAERLSAVYL